MRTMGPARIVPGADFACRSDPSFGGLGGKVGSGGRAVVGPFVMFFVSHVFDSCVLRWVLRTTFVS